MVSGSVGTPVIPLPPVGSVGLAPLTCVSVSVSHRPVDQAWDIAREFSCLRIQVCGILGFVERYNPIIAHCVVMGLFLVCDVSTWSCLRFLLLRGSRL